MRYILSSNFVWILPFFFLGRELRFNCCLATSPDSAVPTAVVSTAVELGVSLRQSAYTCQCVKPDACEHMLSAAAESALCRQLRLNTFLLGCGHYQFIMPFGLKDEFPEVSPFMNPGHRLKFSFHFKKSWIKLIPKGGCTWALAALYLPSS